MPKPDQHTDHRVGTMEQQQPVKPPLFKVLLHNDNYTTMEFVIYVLMSIFHHSEMEATRIMLEVHFQGVGVAGVFTYEIAETKISRVLSLAREYQYPLLCTMEQE
jgi:ATP-dependent Clp protease adaptor protein ClpS